MGYRKINEEGTLKGIGRDVDDLKGWQHISTRKHTGKQNDTLDCYTGDY